MFSSGRLLDLPVPFRLINSFDSNELNYRPKFEKLIRYSKQSSLFLSYIGLEGTIFLTARVIS